MGIEEVRIIDVEKQRLPGSEITIISLEEYFCVCLGQISSGTSIRDRMY